MFGYETANARHFTNFSLQQTSGDQNTGIDDELQTMPGLVETNESIEMNTGAKGVLLVVGAYVVTIGVVAFITLLSIMILLMEPHSCSDMSRALLMLWGTIAAVFLASVIVVGVVAWKVIPGVAGRLAIVAVYGVAMLASYVVIAFGLMVAFNC